MKVVHVTGARPNFPKAAPVIRALEALDVPQLLVHTGQHYDDRMSEIFFEQLGIPRPDVNLGVGSGTHAQQTAAVMLGIEQVIDEHAPSMVLVYGDVNSTVAAALVAAKLHVPVAHVEAGLRSFDREMPEELNRIVTDQLSDLLFATSADAIGHLAREGVPDHKIHFVGNPMIDTLLANIDRFDVARARTEHALDGPYAVATLHRPANVDDDASARRVVEALRALARHYSVVFPVHPRGRERLMAVGLGDVPRTQLVEPLGYLDFMSLVRGADVVVTDSGGVQEETTVLGVPCLTLRTTTERPVTITNGTNRLVTFDDLPAAVARVAEAGRPATWDVPPLWDGRAGERIAAIVARTLDRGPGQG